MKQLLPARPCVLGCGWPDDDLHHYLCCGRYWEFVQQMRPQGLGATSARRGKESALLLSPDLTADDTVRMGAGLYALYRAVNFYRFSRQLPTHPGVKELLNLFARRALDHHPSQQLLNFTAL